MTRMNDTRTNRDKSRQPSAKAHAKAMRQARADKRAMHANR